MSNVIHLMHRSGRHPDDRFLIIVMGVFIMGVFAAFVYMPFAPQYSPMDSYLNALNQRYDDSVRAAHDVQMYLDSLNLSR